MIKVNNPSYGIYGMPATIDDWLMRLPGFADLEHEEERGQRSQETQDECCTDKSPEGFVIILYRCLAISITHLAAACRHH